jgi:hypothetical protein
MKKAKLFLYKKLRQMGIRSTPPLILKVGAGNIESSASLSGHIGVGENYPLLNMFWPQRLYGHFGEENILAFDGDRTTASRLCSSYSN